MALSPSNVILYVADESDYELALGAAAVAGIPEGNVIGGFYTAWNDTASGSYLVIAVGAPANNALYYNPCGWANPAGTAAGSTPFSMTASPTDTLPGANYYENAAGDYGYQTLQIAAAFAYYAMNGSLPSEFSSYPSPISPADTCGGSSSVTCPCITCINGVDAASSLGGIASCLKSNGYAFVGRYLGGPCFSGTTLTKTEAQQIASENLLIASIYSGANVTSSINCGTQTYAQGQSDGDSAASSAATIGQPTGSAIYLDLESGQTSATSTWLSYVQGWVSTVSAKGYKPGVYSSSSQLGTSHSQSWGGSNLLYWVAYWNQTGVIKPAPCPSSELSYAQLWQYAGNTTTCNVSTDTDSAQSTLGLWS